MHTGDVLWRGDLALLTVATVVTVILVVGCIISALTR